MYLLTVNIDTLRADYKLVQVIHQCTLHTAHCTMRLCAISDDSVMTRNVQTDCYHQL